MQLEIPLSELKRLCLEIADGEGKISAPEIRTIALTVYVISIEIDKLIEEINKSLSSSSKKGAS